MDNSVIVLLFVCGTVCYCATTVDPNMCGKGVCCAGYELKGDRCKVCSPGTLGANCSSTCNDGFYGLLCKKDCPPQCSVTCDKISGVCPECRQGLMGENCSQTCSGRFYGRFCKELCPSRCNVTSDKISCVCSENLQKDFKTFLRENIFTVVGVFSIFIVVSSCVGSICVYKSCTRKKNKRRAIVEMAHQNSQPSNHSFSVRYESNDVLNQISTSPQLPQRHQDDTQEKRKQAKPPKVEYSKPKKRYSLVRKVSDSQNVTACNWSDDSDDVFDSDEYDDCVNNVGKVQVSGLPKEQTSFKVEGPPKQQSFRLEGQAVVDVNGAYGNIWL